MSPFGEDEIDGLVDEVEEVGDVQEVDAPATAAPPAAAPAEEGAGMGAGPGEDELAFADESATYGSSVPIEDLLAEDAPVPAPASGSDFEVDCGFDPEWTHPVAPAARAEDLTSVPPIPLSVPDIASIHGPESDVLLTEVASDEDLFSDPSLEIAHLADGQAREIIVPVVLGEGPSARRYKLAIRLRLDAIE